MQDTCVARPVQPPVVILVGTSHPGNVGAAARGAANFGVQQMRFVAPRCDPQGQEALDRSVHARHLLEGATIHDTLEDALKGTSLGIGTTARTTKAANRFLRKTTDVRDWAEGLAQSAWDGQAALVFGREDSGLLAEEVNLLDELVTVPTADYASLNLAHAVSILCYEHYRVRETASISPERVLSPDTLHTLNRAFDALADLVERREWRRTVAKGMWRKIIGRSLPSDHEVFNVIGVLGNTLKRFDHPEFRTAASSKSLAEQGLILKGVDAEPDGTGGEEE